MFLPQLVQDVGRIEASVVAKLPCDHLKQDWFLFSRISSLSIYRSDSNANLKCLGHGSNDELFLASNCSAVVAEIPWNRYISAIVTGSL